MSLRPPRRVLDALLRFRLLLLAVWTVPFALLGNHKQMGDWLFFEFAGRSLIGFTDPRGYTYHGGIHLYAENQQIQIGPPPLLATSALQWFAPSTGQVAMVVVMALAGVLTLGCLERLVLPSRRRQDMVLLTGVVCLPLWGYFLAGEWKHLDDVMAIAGTCAALALCARRHPLLASLCLGTAVAAKPWAIVAIPLLLGLPRADRARALLLTICVAGAWWAPFVFGDTGTARALSGLSLFVLHGSVPELLGLHGYVPGWLRPVQFEVGVVVASWVALKRDWRLVPYAGFAMRIALDPFSWAYYGAGPLLAAVAADLTSRRRLPVWTITTAATFYGVPAFASFQSTPAAIAKLIWVAGSVTALALSARRPELEPEPEVARRAPVPARNLATA